VYAFFPHLLLCFLRSNDVKLFIQSFDGGKAQRLLLFCCSPSAKAVRRIIQVFLPFLVLLLVFITIEANAEANTTGRLLF
jgi:hypothetical protein